MFDETHLKTESELADDQITHIQLHHLGNICLTLAECVKSSGLSVAQLVIDPMQFAHEVMRVELKTINDMHIYLTTGELPKTIFGAGIFWAEDYLGDNGEGTLEYIKRTQQFYYSLALTRGGIFIDFNPDKLCDANQGDQTLVHCPSFKRKSRTESKDDINWENAYMIRKVLDGSQNHYEIDTSLIIDLGKQKQHLDGIFILHASLLKNENFIRNMINARMHYYAYKPPAIIEDNSIQLFGY